VETAIANHALPLRLEGRGMELVLWTEDTDAAFARLVAEGAQVLSAPHDWLGELRLAWITDPDGNPIQLVHTQRA